MLIQSFLLSLQPRLLLTTVLWDYLLRHMILKHCSVILVGIEMYLLWLVLLLQSHRTLFHLNIQLIFKQIVHKCTLREVFLFNILCFVCNKEMTDAERSLIQDLGKCDFGEIHAMHKAKLEARKNMSKEEKQVCNIQFIVLKNVIINIYSFIICHFNRRWKRPTRK